MALKGAVARLLAEVAKPALAKALDGAVIVRYMVRPRVRLTVNGVRFRLHLPFANRVALQDYAITTRRKGVYERLATTLLTRLLAAPGDHCFADIGAFAGYFTAYAAALLGGRGEVVAVESNPAQAHAIARTIALNRFTRTRVLTAALWDREDSLVVAGSMVRRDTAARSGAGATVGQRFDLLCAREGLHPTVVKIDVHGAEARVLAGMTGLLSSSIEYVLLELHPADLVAVHSAGATPADALDVLTREGFACYHVAGHRCDDAPAPDRRVAGDGFDYRPLTPATRDLLLFDRNSDVLVLAMRSGDPAALLARTRPL